MARAKRTDRAEARRRYRAETGADGVLDAETTDAAGSTTAAAPRQRSSSPQFSSPSGRVGIGTAFRQSIHPVNVREDLAALPWLATHTKALWLPILITIVSAVAFAVTANASPTGADTGILGKITQFGFAYFVQVPAIGSVFLAGFLAPRASWLLGAIVGLVSAVAYAAVVAFVAFGTADEAIGMNAMASAFILSPVLGALFAAGAAWYRRFLQLSNPNRGRRAASGKKSSTDGKTRSASKPSGARR